MKSGRRKFGKVLVLTVLFALVVSIGTASITTHHDYLGELVQVTGDNGNLWGAQPLQSSSFESKVQAGDAKAYFQIQVGESVKSYNDSLSSGSHLVQYNIGLSVINADDESDTILGNMTIELEADDIVYIEDEEYAEKNDSFVRWIYPQDIVIEEGDWLWTKVETDFFYSKYIPMTISRNVNKSIYNTDGFQLAKFNVTFEDLPCDSIWGIIQARERTNVNASLLLETFSTDLPIDVFPVQNEHVIQFNAYKSQLEINKTYNFSVIIKVDLKEDKGSAIEYKPRFGISLENAQGGPTQQGFTATIPEYMLPDHVYHASVSTNISNYWTCLPLSMRGMSFYEIHNDVTGSETIYVPDNYTKIQWAVDNATEGDKIIVRDGNYTENVNVNKQHLTIRSENGSENCVVQANNPNKNVFTVTSNNVTIKGFTIKGATGHHWEENRLYGYIGVKLHNANHCKIIDNNVSNNTWGVFLDNSNNNVVTNNAISESIGVGIFLKNDSSDNIVINNTANLNKLDGIRLKSSNNNTIANNTANSNNATGIKLNYSSYNNLTNNIASNNEFGIWLRRSPYNVLRDNVMDHNGLYNLLFGVGYDGVDPPLEWWDNDIDTSNTVNGLPMYYFYNQSNLIIDNYATKRLVVAGCTNVTVRNICYSDGDPMGFILTNDSRFENCTVTDNNAEGFVLLWSHCNELDNNNASYNRRAGFKLQTSTHNSITGNFITGNPEGVTLDDLTSNNLIYNNYFDNANNAYDDGNNIWNITNRTGPNIVEGPYLGGNYWSDYTGEDNNDDGLGDTLLPYNSSRNIQNDGDWLPLVKTHYRWDINEDGITNYLDAAYIGINYGETTTEPYPRYDINEDGVVNYLDAAYIGIHYNEVTP